MHRNFAITSLRLAAGTLLVLATASLGAAQSRSGQVERGSSDVCCLNNFRYTGTCEVTVGSGESCSGVLSYLNNLNSAGRQYCGSTIIRGGWTLVRCGGGAGGVVTSPGGVRATEPTTAPVTGAMRPVSPTTPDTATGGSATFITPVDATGAAQVSEVGLINL